MTDARRPEALYFRIYGDYRGPRPVRYPRQECPWLADLERNWRTIREEFEVDQYERRNPLRPSYVPDDVDIRGWRTVNFVSYRHWYHQNCARFPGTVAILRRIPHLTTACINLLEPHAALPEHNGDTNTTYRCHLGLIVPSTDVDACGLEAGGERFAWREGEAFAFNEAWRHVVWNRTDHPRVILVLDVLRPEYRSRSRAICGAVLGAMALTALETAVPPLRRLRPAPRRLLHRTLGIAASAFLYVRDGAR